jgi:hypothetical protein
MLCGEADTGTLAPAPGVAVGAAVAAGPLAPHAVARKAKSKPMTQKRAFTYRTLNAGGEMSLRAG